MKKNLICLEQDAIELIVRTSVDRLRKESKDHQHDLWLSKDEALGLLKRKSPQTLKQLWDNGDIQAKKIGRLVLYNSQSILKYLEKEIK